MLTLTNRIDMRPGAVPLVIHLGQYDSDFSLVFELYSSAGNFTVESGTTAMIRGTKTDGNAYDADATINISAKTVTVAGSEQMTAAKGRNVYELVLKKGTKVLSTANFILDVERAAMDADTIASESVLKELNAIIAGAETATEAAANAASAADRAEDAAESVSSASTQIATNTADIADLKADFEQLEPGLSAEAKAALLACFAKVAWIDEHGQDYYDALYDALYGGTPPTPSFNYGIYVPESIVAGKYIDANGDIQTSSGTFYIEDYIPVVRSNYWIGMNPSSLRVPAPSTNPTNASDWRISEYDASKGFIKQTHFDSSNALCSSALYDFDSNTKYIRLGWSDSNSSTNSKEFDIENPSEITRVPVEVGNIDASTGADATSTTRVRTVGYIPVSDAITVMGCPFYDSWNGWLSLWQSAGYSQDSFFYAIRCYDQNKQYLGGLTYDGANVFRQNINNVPLLSGTAYVRMIFQTENYAALSTTCVNHLITINGTKYYMEG